MKKLAILLGTLLTISAATSAKEVVPAPVVVEETPVQVIEKEVIVYRDKKPEWKPNGYLNLEQTYYGSTEGQKDTGYGYWNTYNDYMRTQLQGKVNLTPKQSMDFRTRLYQNTHESKKYASKQDQLRLRYYYKHGQIGDSKVYATSRAKYLKIGTGRGLQILEYVLEFDFAKYMFNNEYIKTTRFVVGPSYSFTWKDTMAYDSSKLIVDKYDRKTSYGYTNSVGIYFQWINQLPYGFRTDLEFDTINYSMGSKKGVYTKAEIVNGKGVGKLKKNCFTFPIKFMLSHSANLLERDKYTLSWYVQGGYDRYTFSSLDSFSAHREKVSKETYGIKLQPSITLNYRATNFITLYGIVGAEYRNWKIISQTDASQWRWQPYVTIGMRTSF